MLNDVKADTPPDAQSGRTLCRFCGGGLTLSFVDLGMSPLCESFKSAEQLDTVEHFFPLHPKVCEKCLHVQLPSFVAPEEIFREYAYYSSFSTSWLEHAKNYVEAMTERLHLGPDSFVCELASNDGYLLQYFVGKGPKILGVEPSFNCAVDAEKRGVPTLTEFFGVALADQILASHGPADLILGNNVLAQVPDLNDFVGGIKRLLAVGGTVTLEWPHVQKLMALNQFDTIYHEHFGYFSIYTMGLIFQAHGLRLFDLEELPTHGGSLRVFACHHDDATKVESTVFVEARRREEAADLHDLHGYQGFTARVEKVKRDLLEFLIDAKNAGKRVAGYGAPGKGNTLLNYCGIRTDLLEFTVDRNPYKHGRFTPGTNIPIHDTDRLEKERPDYILLLPWNLREEIAKQLAYAGAWGAKLIVPIPELEIVSLA